MSDAQPILVELYRHNAWANARMVDACRDLLPDHLATELPGTYGRLDQTLVHLARAQGGYLRRLTDWQPGPEHELEYDEPFPGVERIASHLAYTGDRLIEVAAEADAGRVLEFEYEGRRERIDAWVVLLQAAYHATEHRQQIATILTHLGSEPPEPDLWAYWDAIGAAR
jgi:uncharacterized damage-inducible protein DinB